ncbi:MAG: hypothetical protein RLZZ262_444 [Bacteroidota bacterium]
MRKRFIGFYCALLVLVVFAACDDKKTYLVGKYYDGMLFGKKYQIDVVGDSTNYRAQIDSIIGVYEAAFDLSNPNSILSQFNRWQRKDSVFAFVDSSKVFGVVYSLVSDLNRYTNKYYDPTTNPLKRAWVVSKSLGQKEPNLDSLFDFVGFDGAKIDLTEVTSDGYNYVESYVRKADPRIEMDLTNLAGAAALDQINQMFIDKGVLQVRIQYGRSYICHGSHSDSLRLAGLGFANDLGEQKIRLTNHAFTFRTADDKVGLVDPTYGYMVNNEMMYVATACPSLAQAEAFADAFAIMGIEQAGYYYQNDSNSVVQSYIFYLDEENQLRNASTVGFDGMLIIPEQINPTQQPQ